MGNMAAPPDSVAGEAFRWRFSDSGPDIRMRWPAIAGIESEVIEGFKALPKRGAEVGGALLGHQGPAGDFFIDSWRAIPIEHRSGPSYVLSEADIAAWRNFAAQARSSGEGFIGIYRSQTRPGLGVTPEDCAIVEKFLPREKGVLLLIKPLSVSESVATFYLCDGGAIRESSGQSREFSFGGKFAPPGAMLEAPEPAPPSPPSPPPAVQPPASPVEPPARLSRSRWPSIIFPLSAVVAGSAAGFYIHARGGIAPENPVSAPFAREEFDRGLNLRAQPSASGMDLVWDADSPLLQRADHGDLVVDSSRARSDLRLTAAQLRSGAVQLHGSFGPTRFELRIVTTAGREYLESVRVLEPR